MKIRVKKIEPYLVPALLLVIVVVDIILVFLSDGTQGGADDVNHYQLSRYSWQHPHFLLNQWGKPFFTAIMSPFAQFGFTGVRIFNVLAGAATAWFTYRMARLLKFDMPVIAILRGSRMVCAVGFSIKMPPQTAMTMAMMLGMVLGAIFPPSTVST